MKKTLGLLGLLLAFSFVLNSCGKTDTSGCQPASIASEKNTMVAYCTSSSITYTEHSSGLLYQIIDPGTGTVTPTTASTVSVVYTGKLFNGTVFDAAANPYTNTLSNLIDGWKIGIPLIKKGGRIKLIIPSALAYSCTGSGNSIPPNTPLYFDVTLTDVK